ncbi:hypothetical protein B0T09DRAFT_35454 [Sordaria sp. MPI-SDFR-AT-0083]|nr:hypothetical protein B0T09DRAFT_35454 [Sordaria sp. MPI-SDFR-AT-0083]
MKEALCYGLAPPLLFFLLVDFGIHFFQRGNFASLGSGSVCGKISACLFSRLYYFWGRLARFFVSAQSIIISGNILFFGSGRRLNFAGVCLPYPFVMRSLHWKGLCVSVCYLRWGVAISSEIAALSRSSHHSPCDSVRPLDPKKACV